MNFPPKQKAVSQSGVAVSSAFAFNAKLAFAIIPAILYAVFQATVIFAGNLAEDAFILFEYVNHFVQGFGISYNIDGMHVEGATDFLWMFMLSCLGWIGISPPIAAALLNAFGFGLFSWVIVSILLQHQSKTPESDTHKADLLWLQYAAWLLIIVCLLFSHFVFAAYVGFSTALYAGLIALGLKRVQDESATSYRDVPLLALVLGLFRPDGVVLGGIMVLIKLYFAFTNRQMKPLIIWSFVSLIGGIVYFIWRMQYFGELLPLPLYVKSDSTHAFVGYYVNMSWFYENIHWFLITGFLVALCRGWSRLYILAPGFFWFLMLMTSTQTQNIGDRYQMPLFISFIVYMSVVWHKVSWRFSQPALILMVIAGVHLITCYDDLPQRMNQRIWGHHYVVPFAKLIDPYVDDNTKVAVTEAGRIAYFNDAHIIDLVGLNTPELSKNRVDYDYLVELNPDMLFFYHDMLIRHVDGQEGDLIRLNPMAFKQLVDKSRLYKYPDARRERESHAASVAVDYLFQNYEEYEFFLMYMPEFKDHRHVFAIKKDFQYKSEIIDALDRSQRLPSNYYSVMSLSK